MFKKRASLVLKSLQVARFYEPQEQRAGLPHLQRPGDRGVAEEQYFCNADERNSVKTKKDHLFLFRLQRKSFRMLNGIDAQVDVQVRPIKMARGRLFNV